MPMTKPISFNFQPQRSGGQPGGSQRGPRRDQGRPPERGEEVDVREGVPAQKNPVPRFYFLVSKDNCCSCAMISVILPFICPFALVVFSNGKGILAEIT